MGPFPALAPQRISSFLTGLNAFQPALPSHRGLHLVCGLGIPPPKAPAITAEDPLSSPLSGESPGILQKACIPRASLVIKALHGRCGRLP